MSFKSWVSGELVTAADLNTYIQQQVVTAWPNAAARDSAIPAPVEGMYAELADKGLTVYRAGAWRSVLTRAFTARITVEVDNDVLGEPVTLTWPSGLFTANPAVLTQAFTSSVWHSYCVATPTTAGANISVRKITDANPVTASVPVHVMAVEMSGQVFTGGQAPAAT